MRGILDKNDIEIFFDEMGRQAKFYGPKKRGDVVYLSELTSAGELIFDYDNVKLPPKRFFLPQSEVVLSFKDDRSAPVSMTDETSIVFGMRPCDTVSLRHLDRVFIEGDVVDPFYQSRRDSTTIITLTCAEPSGTCFCTSMDGSPHEKEMSDVLATDLGERLFFESCSEKGKTLLESLKDGLKKPTKADVAAREKQWKDAKKRVGNVETGKLSDSLADTEDELWDETTLRCLGCGACGYLCPTCHCFGFYDEPSGRLRSQDVCMFSGFTLEASGHNPRDSLGRRMRQRIMHKFRYSIENYGEMFCVGCGRCVANCPVNIDVREIIGEVQA